MAVVVLITVHALAGGWGVAGLVALALGWPVMDGPSWRWM